jgi:hypothetical protein
MKKHRSSSRNKYYNWPIGHTNELRR